MLKKNRYLTRIFQVPFKTFFTRFKSIPFLFLGLTLGIILLFSSNELGAYSSANIPGNIQIRLVNKTKLKINALDTGNYNFQVKPLQVEKVKNNSFADIKMKHFRVTIRNENSEKLFSEVLNPKSFITAVTPTPDSFSLDLEAGAYFIQFDPIYKDSRNQNLLIEVSCSPRSITIMGFGLPVIALIGGFLSIPLIIFVSSIFQKNISYSTNDLESIEDIQLSNIEPDVKENDFSENHSNFCPKCGLPRESGTNMCSECFSYYEDQQN